MNLKTVLIRKLRTALNILENPLLLKADRNNIKAQFIKDLVVIDKHIEGGINTVLDVGAAEGKYAKAVRFFYPHSTIYAFEPIADSFQKLKAAFKEDSKTKVFNFALGPEQKQADFHLNEWSFSSSLLTMTETHKEIFPHTKDEKVVKIEVKRLDDIPEVEIIRPSLLKIDAQGYEMEILIGCGALLNEFDIVQVEINFESFYDGQANYAALFNFMFEHDFKRFLQLDALYSDNNSLLASDIIFVR